MFYKLISLIILGTIAFFIRSSYSQEIITNIAQANKQIRQANIGEENLPQLRVFISNSMPSNSLKQLAEDVAKVNGVLILRGMVAGSILSTTKFIASLSKEKIPVIIDPKSFKLFAIDKVPSFVLCSFKPSKCLGQDCQNTPIHDRIQGNVSLSYALNQFYQNSFYNKEQAKELLNKLEGRQ